MLAHGTLINLQPGRERELNYTPGLSVMTGETEPWTRNPRTKKERGKKKVSALQKKVWSAVTKQTPPSAALPWHCNEAVTFLHRQRERERDGSSPDLKEERKTGGGEERRGRGMGKAGRRRKERRREEKRWESR